MASIAKFDEWHNTAGNRVNTVIQVVNTFVTERSTWGYSHTSPVIVTPLNAVITPKFSNSKIVVFWQINGEMHHDSTVQITKNGSIAPNGTNTADSNYWSGYSVLPYDPDKDTTPNVLNLQYVDNNVGTTAAVTYGIQFRYSSGTSSTFFLNRPWNSTGGDNRELGTSNAIIMEIAQ